MFFISIVDPYWVERLIFQPLTSSVSYRDSLFAHAVILSIGNVEIILTYRFSIAKRMPKVFSSV